MSRSDVSIARLKSPTAREALTPASTVFLQNRSIRRLLVVLAPGFKRPDNWPKVSCCLAHYRPRSVSATRHLNCSPYWPLLPGVMSAPGVATWVPPTRTKAGMPINSGPVAAPGSVEK